MWMRVKNLRNLETALSEAAEVYSEERPKKDRRTKTKDLPEKDVKNVNRKRVFRIICWVLLITMALTLIVISVVNAVQVNNVKVANEMADTRLAMYEAGLQDVEKIGFLFKIHDDASYQTARMMIPFSDELKAEYFINEHYTGKDKPEIKLTFLTAQYEITENDSVNFLLKFKAETDNNYHNYTVHIEYYNGEIVYMNVLR